MKEKIEKEIEEKIKDGMKALELMEEELRCLKESIEKRDLWNMVWHSCEMLDWAIAVNRRFNAAFEMGKLLEEPQDDR